MRFASVLLLLSLFILSACMPKVENPVDPYEQMNRKIYKFNEAFDATMLRPPAKLYQNAIPEPVRIKISNAFNNIAMLPTIANDLLQAQLTWAIKDTWRFLINSTFGILGLVDIAESNFSLPPHYNDFGLTIARWSGSIKSPYLVLPLLGPSTIKDGLGLAVDYSLFSPYIYIRNKAVRYSIVGLWTLDLRTKLFEVEGLMAESLDKYSFTRDAYLQRRQFLFTQDLNNDSVNQQDMATSYIDE